ncbi:hypothetical protein [Microtetraspora malaysiensis]|uniref:glycine-rich domain-containing protein n=1 Tax=Microtetraspora malaysiensis TaxID=161358 RepID=UPI003D89C67B
MQTSTPRPGHRGAGHLIGRAAGAATGVAAAAGLLLAVAAPAHATTTKPYIKPGTYTFVVPTGVSKIRVVLTGAGGGGGSSAYGSRNRPTTGGAGGGGGGGATAACTLAVRPGDTLTIAVGVGGTSAGAQDGKPGSNSTVSYPNAGGASAEGGRGGYVNHNGGAGGYGDTWCIGTDGGLAFGQAGTSSDELSEGQPGGAPGAGVHSACPAGTGVGGKGGDGHGENVVTNPGTPGGNGCVVLTY